MQEPASRALVAFGPLSDLHVLPPNVPTLLVLAVGIAALFYAYTGTPIQGKQRSAVVTLLIGNVAAFAIQGLTFVSSLHIAAVLAGGFRPWFFINGYQWWAPITSMFLHGSFLHIGANMLFLWFFGQKVEARMGRRAFVVLYIVTGIIAALISLSSLFLVGVETLFFQPDPFTPNIGASGAIMGVVGFTITAFGKEKVPIPIPIGFVAILHPVRPVFAGIFFVGFEFVRALLDPGVAWWAHLAGLFAGMIWGAIWKKHGPRVRIDGVTGWGSGGPVSYTYSYRAR